jgi:hypothetical protein
MTDPVCIVKKIGIHEIGNSELVIGCHACHDHLNFHSILGKSRSVSLADKQNLPVCEAFLWEVQRMSCVAPAGLEHRATESIPFHGFIIPKGTVNIF